MPTRLMTVSAPVNSRFRVLGSWMSARINLAVSSTLNASLPADERVGTRTQWPSIARRVTSSVPTKPVPPRTQIVSLGEREASRFFTRSASFSAQRYQHNRIGSSDLEHQNGGVSGPVFELL